jgi:hypothetical protein
VHAPCEDKSVDVKDSFYEELGQVFDQFTTCDVKMLLSDLNEKVGMQEIFKPTIWNKSSHKISNDDGVREVYFVASKNLGVKCTMFPHCNIHRYT